MDPGRGPPNMRTWRLVLEGAQSSSSLLLISGNDRYEPKDENGHWRTPFEPDTPIRPLQRVGESTLTTRNSDSATLQEGMTEGLVGSEDIEMCWLRHEFFVWCGQPPRSRKREMLSSTGVTAEEGSITFVVLGRVSNATGLLSRLTPDVCPSVAG